MIKTRYKIVEKTGSTFSAPNLGLLVNFEYIASKKLIHVFSFFFQVSLKGNGSSEVCYAIKIILSISYASYSVGECDFNRFFFEERLIPRKIWNN